MHFFRLKQLTVAILQPLPVNSFLCQFALFANLSQVSSVLLPYICKLFVRSSCYFFLKPTYFQRKENIMNCTKDTLQISRGYWIYISNLFPKEYACPVQKPNIEISIKLTPLRVHLGPNDTNCTYLLFLKQKKTYHQDINRKSEKTLSLCYSDINV